MENVIAGVVVAVIFFGAVFYIIKQKRKGTKCIGCPSSGSCKKCQSGGRH